MGSPNHEMFDAMPKNVPVRDARIPKAAVYDPASATWQLGSDKDHLQIWHPCGRRIFDATFEEGKLHGRLELKFIGAFEAYGTDHFAFCTSLVEKFGLPDGDDLGELRAEYRAGELQSAKFLVFMGEPHEEERLLATLRDGQLERLRWHITGTAQTIFSHRGLVVDRKAMKIPKPWPDSIELTFVKGKPKTRTYLDKKGKPLEPEKQAPKVGDWGQTTKKAALDGYIVSGRFAADVAAFFPERKPGKFDEDAKRAKKVFARLPEPHRAAAVAFDALVKKGLPELQRASLSGYGFDCVKNELADAAESKYFGLSYTMDGDLQLLDLETGQVLEWVHDYTPFEEDAVFPTLDAYAFAILRIELAAEKRIPKSEVTTLFERLGFGWAAKLV